VIKNYVLNNKNMHLLKAVSINLLKKMDSNIVMERDVYLGNLLRMRYVFLKMKVLVLVLSLWLLMRHKRLKKISLVGLLD
jgi:hypothetical protein